jgi:uncharacterized membrane protein YfcA
LYPLPTVRRGSTADGVLVYTVLKTMAVGLGQGGLAGAFGIGGSRTGTPLLRLALGVSPLVAPSTPLPLTVPAALAGVATYARQGLVDWRAVGWTAMSAVPLAAIGAICTHWLPSEWPMVLVALSVLWAGAQLWRQVPVPMGEGTCARSHLPATAPEMVVLGGCAGLLSRLLANSGGFLLGPLIIARWKVRVRPAVATGLACAPSIATPGVAVHALLGRSDWLVALYLSIGSALGSYAGARASLKTRQHRLRRPFAVLLLLFGTYFLVREPI